MIRLRTALVSLGLVWAAAAAGAIGFRASEDTVYTLYRSSATSGGASMRVHVATFDSADGEDYNRENCQIARELFAKQSGVIVRYWCEKGYFRK